MSICQKTGAWLHADEVYRGTELNAQETPSFWGMYDRVICVNSMSKAYGLAGLRIGWAMAAPEMVEELWRRHEYAVIAAAGPSMKLAEIALQPAKRASLAGKTAQAFPRRPHAAGKLGASAGGPVLREPGRGHLDRFCAIPF